VYELLGIILTLAALLSLNALASLAASLVWRFVVSPLMCDQPAVRRGQVLFALRVLPPACALACVSLLILPAYIHHEPRSTPEEEVSGKLIMLASLSAVGIALAAWRGLASWLATRRLVRGWMRGAVPVRLKGIDVPAYRIRHAFPLIGLVGIWRPRLFVAGQVFETLTEEEMAAAVAHETGHLRAHDNLRRALIRACRDALCIIPCGRSLDAGWRQASEAAADEYAARGGRTVALDLAAALIKVARLVPEGAKPAVVPASLFIGEREEGVAERVERLLNIASRGGSAKGRSGLLLSLLSWGFLSALLVLSLTAASHPETLPKTHAAIEHAVWFLQ
jgi:Zn-dependent protease with chaperone function